MTIIIKLFGTLMLLAGIVIIINPDRIFGLFRNNVDNLLMHIIAVLVRLIIGVFLILQADISRFPLTMQIIGWMSITAAIFFTVIGRANFSRIINWGLSMENKIGRFGGVIAVCFGAFLVYAFV